MALCALPNGNKHSAAFEVELASEESVASLDGLARARRWTSDVPGAIGDELGYRVCLARFLGPWFA